MPGDDIGTSVEVEDEIVLMEVVDGIEEAEAFEEGRPEGAGKEGDEEEASQEDRR